MSLSCLAANQANDADLLKGLFGDLQAVLLNKSEQHRALEVLCEKTWTAEKVLMVVKLEGKMTKKRSKSQISVSF